jgi:3-oxoacyl-[acyl-carrier protein] reductase
MSDLFDVSKETLLITGAFAGAGAAIRPCAVGAWRRGGAGGAADRQAEESGKEIRGKGGRAAAVQMDVTETASIGKALAFAPRNDVSGAAPP